MNCTGETVEFCKSRSNKFDTEHDNLPNETEELESMAEGQLFLVIFIDMLPWQKVNQMSGKYLYVSIKWNGHEN